MTDDADQILSDERKRMDRSDSINELASALAKAQAQIKSAPKDSVNPHFKSRYADLASAWDAVREALTAQGLSVTQHPSARGPTIELVTMLLHSSGQWIASTLTMTSEKNTPQSIGSAITYARRYALMAIVGIAADDDDGNQASGSAAPPVQTEKAQLAVEWGNAAKAFAELGKKETDILAYLGKVTKSLVTRDKFSMDHVEILHAWYDDLTVRRE